jgi:hypothetical protein
MASFVVDQDINCRCNICQFECDGYYIIRCDNCHQWYHQNCEKLPSSDFNFLQEAVVPYLCSKCCENENGEYSFDQALTRIEQALSGNIQDQVQVERIFMRSLRRQLKADSAVRFGKGMSKDYIALRLLHIDSYIPVTVSANGNGLFNALSMAIQGDENLASELRVRTFIEMFRHKSFYVDQHQGSGTLSSIYPSFDEARINCGQNFVFSCGWTMHAAASVCTRSIISVYPSVNGPLDQCVSILNREFKPRIPVRNSKNTVHILWSGLKSETEGMWKTTHCVPLLLPPSSNVDESSANTSCSPSVNHDHCYARFEKRVANTSTIGTTALSVVDLPCSNDIPHVAISVHSFSTNPEMHIESSTETQQATSSFGIPGSPSSLQPCSGTQHQNHSFPNVGSADTSYSISLKSCEQSSSGNDVTNQPHLFSSSPNQTVHTSRDTDTRINPRVRTGCLQKSFLEVHDIIKVLQNCPYSMAHPFIPPGIKNNVYFVVQNSENIEIREPRMKRGLDDCGIWHSRNGYSKICFIKTKAGNLNNVMPRKNKFYYQRRSRTKVKYDLIEPQPDPSTVLTLRRYYATLKLDPTYKKRVSWLETQSSEDIFVAEYLGKYPC